MSDMRDRARQLLAEASLISEASAASLEPSVSHGKAEDSAPRSAGLSTFDWMAQLFAQAKTDEALRGALKAAEEEMDRLRGQYERPKLGDARKRVLLFGGTHYKQAAIALYSSDRSVRRWREEYGLEPNYGRPQDEDKAA